MPRKKSTPKSDTKETRTRAWTFCVYEDSAPENWQALLDDLHIQWVESPWHDQDINGDGSPKKKHKHILLAFDSVKSYDQVLEITKTVNAPIPQRCHDMRALVRYFAHIDNPDKAQYPVQEIIGHAGFDVGEMFKPSSSERLTLFKEILTWAREYNVTEYADLIDYAQDNRPDDWLPVLVDGGTIMFTAYFKSARERYKRNSEGDNNAV